MARVLLSAYRFPIGDFLGGGLSFCDAHDILTRFATSAQANPRETSTSLLIGGATAHLRFAHSAMSTRSRAGSSATVAVKVADEPVLALTAAAMGRYR